MLLRVVLLFLVLMALLGMFGKMRLPKPPDIRRLNGRKCPKCGTYRIGSGPCPCGEGNDGK